MESKALANVSLEQYFAPFRENVVGYNQEFLSPYGSKRILYADWTASGRLYHPIEDRIHKDLGPFVANTHTETNATGTAMTLAYHEARHIIKEHVNANQDDVLIMTGSGMTGAVAKFQRILGWKLPEQFLDSVREQVPEEQRPVIFVTHMEHHSNHTSWLETLADVECIMPDEAGLINLNHLEELLEKYKSRETKVASVTAASNVSGIQTCYQQVARIMHAHGGLCFVDFACAGPYVDINMHPADSAEKLDAIYLSPHKFLGGPGTPGVLIFDRNLYKNRVPDQPGGGTVSWTNPWGEHHYFSDIEVREDGGTPAFLQTIRTALAFRLKEQMGVRQMANREHEMLSTLFRGLDDIPGLHILASEQRNRLGVVSFYVENLHFNLGVKLLNDKFGIQTRGGCSCAGTYGHYLLNITPEVSHVITREIDAGSLTNKPGWIRLSVHPIMTDAEIQLLLEGLDAVARNHARWAADYQYQPVSNEFVHLKGESDFPGQVKGWFQL